MDYSLPGEGYSADGPWSIYLSSGFALPDISFSADTYDNEAYFDRSGHQSGPYHSDSAGKFPESDPLSRHSDSLSNPSCHGSLNCDQDGPSNQEDETEQGTDDRESLKREKHIPRRSASNISNDSLVCGFYCCCCCDDQTNLGKRARWLVCFILKASIVLGCFIVMVVLLIRYRPGRPS